MTAPLPPDPAVVLTRLEEAHRPALLAAVRGVLALAEDDDKIRGDYGYRIRNGLDPSPGDRIRAAVAAALGETGGGQ